MSSTFGDLWGRSRPALGQHQLRLAIGVAATVAILSAPSPAQASFDPVGSGTTTITIDKGFSKLLAAHGVTLTASAPAKRKGASLSLPVETGQVDPTAAAIALDQQGALSFRRGARKVILRQISVKTNHTPLIAKVGGGQLKIAVSTKRHFARQGFGSSFEAKGLRLSAKVATRLSKKLALPGVFEQGETLGALRSSVQPLTSAILPIGKVSLIPDPTFLAKLKKLFVSANPVAPAELVPVPAFSLPLIPAGTIAPDASSGVPRSGGSLEFLQLGAGQIFWHELWFDLANHQVLAEVDIEPTPTFPGKLGQVPILGLDTSSATVLSDPGARSVALSGARLSLNPASAAAFDQAFAAGAPTFAPGEVLGTLAFSASTQ